MQNIFIIEDENSIRDIIEIALKGFGYQTVGFCTAEEALIHLKKEQPDLFIVDWMLPQMSGIDFIREIRRHEICKEAPILMLTAKGSEYDKITGLDSGADDYLVKPFSMLELAARIRSLLRRIKPNEQEKQGLRINEKTREVQVEGTSILLTFKEFELLNYLFKNKDRVVKRDELLDSIWGYGFEGETRTLDIHIRTLRQKLGEKESANVVTVRGVGYRYVQQ